MEFSNKVLADDNIKIIDIVNFIKTCEDDLINLYPYESAINREITFDELESLIIKLIYDKALGLVK